MLHIFYLVVIIVACEKQQPRPPVTGSGKPNPCAQYADGICPLYDAELDGSGSNDDNPDNQSTTQPPDNRPEEDNQLTTAEIDQQQEQSIENPSDPEQIALYTGFMLKDNALYPLFLADDQQQKITKSRFSYGGAGFESQKLPDTSGLQFTFELVVTLEFVTDSGVFCARSSLDKSRLGKILQWKDQQLQANGFPLAKERGGYPNLRKMNIKEGGCR